MARRDPTPFAASEPVALAEHAAAIRRLARSLTSDGATADDVAQETMRVAIEHPPRAGFSPFAWLAGIARNVARTDRRSKARRARWEVAAARADHSPAVADSVAQIEQARLVVDAVLALDEPYRSTVGARWFEGLPPREIAKRHGVPVDTVRRRCQRALELLRAALDRRHGGDRRLWLAAIAPLSKRAPMDVLSTILGGVAVGTAAKVSIGAAVVLVAALAWTRPWSSPSETKSSGATDAAAPPSLAGRGPSAPPALSAKPGSSTTGIPSPTEASVPETTTSPSASRVRIHGTVSTSDGKPATAGVVTVQRWIKKAPLTVSKALIGASGAYEAAFALDPLPGGDDAPATMRVLAIVPTWAPASLWVDIPRAGEYAHDLRVEPGVVAGRVVDGDGRPVAGVELAAVPVYRDTDIVDLTMLEARDDEVREGEARTVTHDDGSFELRGLAGSSKLISASRAWCAKEIVAGVGDRSVVVTVVPALSIAGTVKDARSGEPVEAVVFFSHPTGTRNADGSESWTYWETSARTVRGRFLFISPIETSTALQRFSVRAAPVSPDWGEASSPPLLAHGERRADVELLVEPAGSGQVVLEVTTPRGAPFDGPLDVKLLPRGWAGSQREVVVVKETSSRYRIPVVADRDWDLWIEPACPNPVNESCMSPIHIRLPVRVKKGEETTARAVLPRYGHMRLRWAGDGASVRIEPLDPGRSGTTTQSMSPGVPPPPEGIPMYALEGRYRATIVDGPAPLSREFEIREGEEAVVDLR